MAVFSGLDTEAYDRTYSDQALIQRIGSYIGRYSKRTWGIIFFVSIVSFAGAGQPLVVSQAIGSLSEPPGTGLIMLLFGLMTLFGVGK